MRHPDARTNLRALHNRLRSQRAAVQICPTNLNGGLCYCMLELAELRLRYARAVGELARIRLDDADDT